MSKLSFEITRVDVKSIGNYFIVVQLDETEYPSKLVRTQKFRTEVDYSSEFPQFFKTFFEFKGVILGNRIIFRIGLFNLINIDNIPQEDRQSNQIVPNILFKNSSLVGSSDIILGATWVDLLRGHKFVESDSKLIHPEKRDKEVGHVYFKISMRPETLDAKIYENNSEIEDMYYNPFETDSTVITNKLRRVIVLNEEKQMKLDKQYKAVNEINNKVKLLAMDKKYTHGEIKQLEEENNSLKKSLNKIQNYDEIHIEVDLLSQSNQGVAILEKKYAVLLGQLAIQGQVRMEYECEYQEIDPLLSKIKIIKERVDMLKSANGELKFNHKRHEDMLPLITTYEEKIKNNDKIISNLKDSILDVLKIRKEFNSLSVEEIKSRIKTLEDERKKMDEKKIQMNLYLDVYSPEGEVRTRTNEELAEPFYRIVGNDPTMNEIINASENVIIEKSKMRITDLKSQVEDLSAKLDQFEKTEKEKKERGIVIDPALIVRRNDLKTKLEIMEKKEALLLRDFDIKNDQFDKESYMLKYRIVQIDNLIERELKMARIRKFEEEMDTEKMKNYYDNYYK